MRAHAINVAFFLLALALGLAMAQLPNPLTAGSPLEAMKKKTEAAYGWLQDETAEVANTGYRLKTIYQQNKTIPRKYLTLLNTSLSYFDAAWARAREIRLHPDTTIAIKKELLNQYDCVTTPAEFLAAFKANTPRCVSDDLVGRLSVGNSVEQAANRSAATDLRAANFWTGSDSLAKYLLIGFPKSIGINVPEVAPNAYNTQGYDSANFAGLKEYRNGQGLVGVGWGADWSVTDTYSLAVFSKSAIRAAMRTDDSFYQETYINANVNGVRPYWKNVKLYFEYTYQPFGLKIPQAAIDVIANNTFTQLTGCGAQCTYTATTAFPSTCFPHMTYRGVRTSATTCTDPSTGPAPTSWDAAACGPWATPTTAPGWALVPPTNIDMFGTPCSAEWLQYMGAFEAVVNNLPLVEQRTLAESVGVMMTYMMLLPSATTPTSQALLTRAFLAQRSQGYFGPLFTGNGYKAGGASSIFAGDSTEFLFSPFFSKSLPPKARTTVQFCLNGVNGGVPIGGNCNTLTPPAP